MDRMEKKKKIGMHITAFSLALIFAAAAYAANGIYPFGGESVLTSDLRTQYIAVVTAFFEQLKGGENAFVTWRSGLGSNIYAVVMYVMASPTSLLFLLFDAGKYQEIYLAVILLKTAFVSLCFSVYASESRLLGIRKTDLNVAFSLCYALSAFTLKATINPMWLENIALLPLLLLGVEHITDKKQPLLFYAAAAGCFITNYYLAYMSGLFAIIYFAYYCFVFKQNRKNILVSLVYCGVFAVLAVCTAMFVILPSYSAVSGTYTEVAGVGYEGNILKFSPKNIIFIFSHVTSEYASSGYPNAYFGLLPAWLAAAYFANKSISKRERAASLAVVLLFLFSLLTEPLYIVWHLFREPTGFDGRFLYTAVLFALILAGRSANSFEGLNKKVFAAVGAVLLLLAFYSVTGRFNLYYVLSLAALTVLFGLYGIFTAKGCKRLAAALMIIEMLVVSVNEFRIIKLWDVYAPHEEFLELAERDKANFEELKKYDGGFYRADADYLQSDNNSMTVGYNSISHYSSLANQKTFDVMRRLGVMTAMDNKVLTTSSQNVVLDSLFNVKYFGVMDKNAMLSDGLGRISANNGMRLTNPLYKPVVESENAVFFENSSVFPLMFAVEKDLSGLVLDESNAFENQNKLFSEMTGKSAELYEPLHIDDADTANCTAEVSDAGLMKVTLTNLQGDKILAENASEAGRVDFTCTAEKAGNYFTVLGGEFPDNAKIPLMCGFYIEGVPQQIYDLKNELKDMGYYKAGDKLSLIYTGLYKETSIYWPTFYRLNEDVFSDVSEYAQSNALEDIKEERGNITAVSGFDRERLVFSSIAYDEGMHVYIDGNETEKIRLAEGFLGYYVPAGKHNIEIKYVSPGAAAGAAVSAAALVLSAALLLLNGRIRRRYAEV